MNTPKLHRPNNSLIAGVLLESVQFNRASAKDAIEKVLDTYFPSRRAKAASRGCQAVARTGDKQTSVVAANQVNVTKRELQVLRALSSSSVPLTTYDIETITGVRYGSITPRMKPLFNKGMVKEVGVDTSSGRGRTTYDITSDGYRFVREHRLEKVPRGSSTALGTPVVKGGTNLRQTPLAFA